MKPELDHQIKFLNFCGIYEHNPIKRIYLHRIYNCVILISTVSTTYLLASSIISNYTDVLRISENLGSLIVGFFTPIKYVFMFFYSRVIFDMLRQIKELNKTCKLTFEIFV